MGKAIITAGVRAFSVCLLFITCQQEQKEIMGSKSEILSIDPAGYFIEFDQFLKDPKNQRILQLL